MSDDEESSSSNNSSYAGSTRSKDDDEMPGDSKDVTEIFEREEEEEEEGGGNGEMDESESGRNHDDAASSVGGVGGGNDESQVAQESSGDSERFKKTFDMFDLDQSGEITAVEFGTVMRALGQNPTDEEIESLLKSVDLDLDGKLNFDEFQKLMTMRMESRKEMNEEDIFREAFKVFDKDNSGKISRDELRNIVTSYGKMKLTDVDADEMLSSADADGDGFINYEEFVKMFTNDKGIEP